MKVGRKKTDCDLRSVSIASVNEVERESKLFSGTGEIADSAQLSRSCEQNRDYEVSFLYA